MKLLLDSFWRAMAYLVLPRVIGLSLLPLLVAAALSFALGWFFWEPAVAAVQRTLEDWSLTQSVLGWLDTTIGPQFRKVIGPLVVVALAVPVIVVVSLLLVAWSMTSAVVDLVHDRRFTGLERRHGAAAWRGVIWSLACTVAALLALFVTIPLWLIPPLVLIIPPLIWGWLTMQVMSFDVLADHASAEERRAVLTEHRWPLLVIGIVCGYLGAAPSLLWAFGALALVFAPVLVAVTIWLYTLIFAFAALWFAHYALSALQLLRASRQVEVTPLNETPTNPASSPPTVEPPPALPPA